MINILIATGNSHKFQEIKLIMSDYTSLNIVYPDKSFDLEIVENGKTYSQNAKIKTDAYADFLNNNPSLKSKLNLDYIISEDSGLEAACIGNIPGLVTARFAGENASDTENISKLLDIMKATKGCMENRDARFICVACLYDVKKDESRYFEGELKGSIAGELSGTKGFGYDPVFFVPDFNKTLAQIDSSDKNKISHRAKAFKKIAKAITF